MFTEPPQMKFSLIRNESMVAEYSGYKWWVPVSYASKTFNDNFNKTQPEFWMTKKEKSLVHDVHVEKRDWLIVNVQETGYYRVNYDAKNWRLITEQLNENHSIIHTVNRAQLLDDALNLARASLIPYDMAFNVTQFLRNDNEYLPWEAFLNNFQYISTMLLRTPSFGAFKVKYNIV
jgi:aminopeptidase N